MIVVTIFVIIIIKNRSLCWVLIDILTWANSETKIFIALLSQVIILSDQRVQLSYHSFFCIFLSRIMNFVDVVHAFGLKSFVIVFIICYSPQSCLNKWATLLLMWCAGKYELRASNPDMKIEVKGSTQVAILCLDLISTFCLMFISISFVSLFSLIIHLMSFHCTYYVSNIVFLSGWIGLWKWGSWWCFLCLWVQYKWICCCSGNVCWRDKSYLKFHFPS